MWSSPSSATSRPPGIVDAIQRAWPRSVIRSPLRWRTSVGACTFGTIERTSTPGNLLGDATKRSKRAHHWTKTASPAPEGPCRSRFRPVPISATNLRANASCSSGVRPYGQSGPRTVFTTGAYRTSDRVRSGYEPQNSSIMAPPRAPPNTAARSEPAASITARRSSICTSSTGGSSPMSESPIPRMSNRISRENDASRSRNRAHRGSSHMTSRFDQIPGA